MRKALSLVERRMRDDAIDGRWPPAGGGSVGISAAADGTPDDWCRLIGNT